MKKLTLAAIVSSFAAALISDKRDDGQSFIRLADGSPQWMLDIVRAAHNDMLPNDVRYKMIQECADSLNCALSDDTENFDDIEYGEIADNLVDIYNSDRLQWLSSSLYRAEYCDDAQSEGLVSEDTDMFTRIGMGQYMEYQEILSSLLNSLQSVYDEQEDEEENDE